MRASLTTLDKSALLHVDYGTLRPLVGAQTVELRRWLAARFARPAFSDEVHDLVLPAVRRTLVGYAKEIPRGEVDTRGAKVTACARERLVKGTERHVDILALLDVRRSRQHG